MLSAQTGFWPVASIGDKYKAGSTRDIDAAFRPEGGIFLRPGFYLGALFHVAVQRNSLLFFFRARCRKNAGRVQTNPGSGTCSI
jgi:hypothetical protein